MLLLLLLLLLFLLLLFLVANKFDMLLFATSATTSQLSWQPLRAPTLASYTRMSPKQLSLFFFVFQMRSRGLSLVLAAPRILSLLFILPAPGLWQHHPEHRCHGECDKFEKVSIRAWILHTVSGTMSKLTPSLSKKNVTLLHWMSCYYVLSLVCKKSLQ